MCHTGTKLGSLKHSISINQLTDNQLIDSQLTDTQLTDSPLFDRQFAPWNWIPKFSFNMAADELQSALG